MPGSDAKHRRFMGKQLSEVEAEQQRLNRLLPNHMADEPESQSPTNQLQRATLSSIKPESWTPKESTNREPGDYRVVPENIPAAEAMKMPRWRIELHRSDPISAPIIRLDILDDIVLGRAQDVDVNLSAYDALQLGVSRHHALLRPTDQNLYLIDLSSTNGTYYNATPVTSGAARRLINDDVITLGRLILTVKVIGRIQPESSAAEQQKDASRDPLDLSDIARSSHIRESSAQDTWPGVSGEQETDQKTFRIGKRLSDLLHQRGSPDSEDDPGQDA